MAPTNDDVTRESIDLGHVLHEARIHRRLSLDEASQELKIRRDYLLALEQNRWQDLPGEVYGQGFLRNYGRLLDLDGDRLVEVRRTQLGPDLIPSVGYETPKRTGIYTASNESRGSSSSPKHPKNRRSAAARPTAPPAPISTRSVVTLLVVIALLFVGGWYLLSTPGHRVAAPTPRTSSSHPQRQKKSPTSSKTRGHKKTTTTQSALNPTSTATQGRITVATYDISKPIDVVIQFHGACWMGYQIDGASQIGHVYQTGQTVSLQATHSLDLIFGTHAFSLTVNRRAVSLPTTPVLWQLNFVKSAAP